MIDSVVVSLVVSVGREFSCEKRVLFFYNAKGRVDVKEG